MPRLHCGYIQGIAKPMGYLLVIFLVVNPPRTDSHNNDDSDEDLHSLNSSLSPRQMDQVFQATERTLKFMMNYYEGLNLDGGLGARIMQGKSFFRSIKRIILAMWKLYIY